jgi:hypothetical protein
MDLMNQLIKINPSQAAVIFRSPQEMQIVTDSGCLHSVTTIFYHQLIVL